MEAGLALGTNIGDRLEQLRMAKERILAIPGISFVTRSPVYETEPIGVPDEFAHQAFLNCVLIVEIHILIERLVALFQSVEREMGRKKDEGRNMPRPIDIDLIYAGMLQEKIRNVEIPHPRWFTRRFVVQPLCDVRADLRIPGQSGTVADVLSGLADKSTVSRFAEEW